MRWLTPALIVLALMLTSGPVKSRVNLSPRLIGALWLLTLAGSLFNLVYFVIL